MEDLHFKGAEEEIKIVSFRKLILKEKGGKGTMVLKKSVKSLVKRGGVLRPSGLPQVTVRCERMNHTGLKASRPMGS